MSELLAEAQSIQSSKVQTEGLSVAGGAVTIAAEMVSAAETSAGAEYPVSGRSKDPPVRNRNL